MATHGPRNAQQRGTGDALTEHEHQVRLFLLVARLSEEFPTRKDELDDVWANPNGGHRLPAVAGKLKAEGVRSGVPDVTCAVPRGGYHGLYIELKKHGGRATRDQRTRLERLRSRGYDALCIEGWIPAAQYLCAYLGIAWQTRWIDLIEWHATATNKGDGLGRRRSTRRGSSHPRTKKWTSKVLSKTAVSVC